MSSDNIGFYERQKLSFNYHQIRTLSLLMYYTPVKNFQLHKQSRTSDLYVILDILFKV